MAQLRCVHEDDRVIRLKVTVESDDVRLEETPMGVRVQVAECHTGGLPGAPALPHRLVRVALPEGMWPEPLWIKPAKAIDLTGKPTLVVPAQPLQPGLPRSPGRTIEAAPIGEPLATNGRCDDDDPRPDGRDRSQEDVGYRVEPFPVPEPVPPDPALYEQAARDSEPARITSVDYMGSLPVVSIDLRPVRYTDSGHLELVSHFTVEVPYSTRPRERASTEELRKLLETWGVDGIDAEALQPLPEPIVTSAAQAERFADLVRQHVLNPEIVKRIEPIALDRYLPADYLIVTDNQSWNPDTISPTGPLTGDLVAQFERLATHKRSRGLSAKVVTVADIVQGRYGDFRTGARDLPEVIRRFLKDVYQRWGVAWALLGGDVAVIPPRYAAGAIEGHVDVATTDPPENNKSFWAGGYLKMHAVNPGTWWPGNTPRQLVNAATGALIPYDSTGGTAALGWYWTANDYATVSATPTEFVRVNGPAAIVNGRLQWLYQWNRIPTDFYYSSLQGWVVGYHDISVWLASTRIPYVYFPAHDWDALDNGIYGQYVGGADVDGVHWYTDVSVGRAPVQTADEAQAFVDKVIAYENYSVGALAAVAPNSFARRVFLASGNWGGSTRVLRDLSDPPGNNAFRPGTNATVIHLENAPANFDYQLIAEISDSDRRELPYNPSSSPTSRGWHFARSATDHAQKFFTISIWTSTFTFPVPSNWIVVHGPADELDPPSYLFDAVALDGSAADQEALRVQLAGDFAAWDNVSRLYQDLTDLTPAQQAAGSVAYLTTTRVRDSLNAAPHIVSLSGHGNPDGCCGGSVWLASGLTNGLPGFIGYADSCLTGASDSEDSFAETLIKNPAGGAVAYVGSTRFSWIGLGDDLQRAFFKQLTTTRHLGLLNDARIPALDYVNWHAYARWASFSLTLYGDPEMNVWRRPPRSVWPKFRWPRGDLRVPILVELPPKPPKPDPPPFRPIPEYVIHVAQGDFERTVLAVAGTTVPIDVSDAEPGELTLTVALAAAGEAAPFTQTLRAFGPRWLSGRVVEVSPCHEARAWSEICLDTAEGVRRLVVSDDGSPGCPHHDLIMQSVLHARSVDEPISVLVDRDVDHGRIEQITVRSAK